MHTIPRLATRVALMILIVAVGTGTARAQSGVQADLIGFIDEMTVLQPNLEQLAPELPEQFAALADARAKIAAANPESLTTFQEAVAVYPNFWDIPATLQASIEEQAAAAAAAEAASAEPRAVPRSSLQPVCGPDRGDPPDQSNCATRSLRTTCSGCPPTAGFGEAAGIPTKIALSAAVIVAEGVVEVLNDDFWPSIPNPVKIALSVALFILKEAELAVEGVIETEVECENNWIRSVSKTNLDTTISSRASQEQLDRVADTVAELGDDNFRRAVEANLFAFRQDVPVARFLLPKPSLCSKAREIECTVDADCLPDGGTCSVLRGIELARDIVREAIDEQVANGNKVFKAETHFAEAETLKAASMFKDAYNEYREAYRDATR